MDILWFSSFLVAVILVIIIFLVAGWFLLKGVQAYYQRRAMKKARRVARNKTRFSNGKKHRVSGAVEELADGTQFMYVNGELRIIDDD